MASTVVASADLPITVKCTFNGQPRRFKISLRDVLINSLENKLREVLDIAEGTEVLIERYSDSAGAYVVLDRANTSVYKQLYRAAKAKQKLKLRINTEPSDSQRSASGPKPATVEDEPEAAVQEVLAAALAASAAPTTKAEPEPLISFSTALQREERSLADLEEALDRLESTMSLTKATETMKKEHEKITRDLDILEASVNALSGRTRTGAFRNGCEIRRFPAAMGHGMFGAQGPLSRCPAASSSACTYAVCCNICDKTIPGAHYHCSTCDDGDFDLCQECVDQGRTCKGADHWLIKRFVKDGVFINSTTERIPPKPKAQAAAASPAPAAREPASPAAQALSKFLYQDVRTCNCCVTELPESDFVHCNTCEDFDLCKACFVSDQHGHHPKHAFSAAVANAVLELEIASRLAAGRNVSHNAICDGCDKPILGIRHKCLDCPDWDYCNSCIENAGFIHPEHRFVPVYEQLESPNSVNSRAYGRAVHVGICCDGPLCSQGRDATWIVGERYKCAVCHDTDFCANCEACPTNPHNKTHPLIKFKTPVKNVSVSTTGTHAGQQMPVLGDQPQPRRPNTSSRATETTVAKDDIVKTEVQTVADVKPDADVKEAPVKTPAPAAPKPVTAEDLVAVYTRDSVADGTVLPPDHVFAQTWYLRNEGTVAWPAGCTVKFVGGDYMGRVDPNHPAGVAEVADSYVSYAHQSPVPPGATVAFSVLLRTPPREGKVISYWRLTTPDGIKFGHRIWCDINVQIPKYQQEAKQEAKQEPAEEKEVPAAVVEEPTVDSTEESPKTTTESQMIFPKLEKESPTASIHQEPAAETQRKDESEAPPAYEEEYEELSTHDEWAEEESEAGFLTDEEYDVLDASDEEFLEEQQKKQLKK